jgi:hypothetical protein
MKKRRLLILTRNSLVFSLCLILFPSRFSWSFPPFLSCFFPNLFFSQVFNFLCPFPISSSFYSSFVHFFLFLYFPRSSLLICFPPSACISLPVSCASFAIRSTRGPVTRLHGDTEVTCPAIPYQSKSWVTAHSCRRLVPPTASVTFHRDYPLFTHKSEMPPAHRLPRNTPVHG